MVPADVVPAKVAAEVEAEVAAGGIWVAAAALPVGEITGGVACDNESDSGASGDCGDSGDCSDSGDSGDSGDSTDGPDD